MCCVPPCPLAPPWLRGPLFAQAARVAWAERAALLGVHTEILDRQQARRTRGSRIVCQLRASDGDTRSKRCAGLQHLGHDCERPVSPANTLAGLTLSRGHPVDRRTQSDIVYVHRRQVEALLPGLGPAHPVQGGMWTRTDGRRAPCLSRRVRV